MFNAGKEIYLLLELKPNVYFSVQNIDSRLMNTRTHHIMDYFLVPSPTYKIPINMLQVWVVTLQNISCGVVNIFARQYSCWQ